MKRNEEVLILTSTGGSGKSTMAGLLLLNGFEFFSDDFVPVDTKNQRVFPFPAALCVKNNAISILESKGLEFQPFVNGKSAYAKLTQKKIQSKACRMNKVVFIKYNSQSDLIFEPISTLEALYHFLQEAWVGDDIKRARRFINWFSKLQFYRLEYGNNGKAIEILAKLMDKG
jgi:CO dehydrogenase nickel-insertion accessory protein CooC1